MHELSIAAELVRCIENHQTGYPGSRVGSVRILVGTISGVDPEALRRVFPVVSEGTPVEGSDLIIEIVQPSCKCSECGANGLAFGVVPCPLCGSFNLKIITGNELEIESIEFILEDDESIKSAGTG
jgi:hydrogenase nickel incorporation protein HypA/HybF